MLGRHERDMECDVLLSYARVLTQNQTLTFRSWRTNAPAVIGCMWRKHRVRSATGRS